MPSTPVCRKNSNNYPQKGPAQIRAITFAQSSSLNSALIREKSKRLLSRKRLLMKGEPHQSGEQYIARVAHHDLIKCLLRPPKPYPRVEQRPDRPDPDSDRDHDREIDIDLFFKIRVRPRMTTVDQAVGTTPVKARHKSIIVFMPANNGLIPNYDS